VIHGHWPGDARCGWSPGALLTAPERRTLMNMSDLAHQDLAHQPYELIHLGDQTAAIVPLDELRRLRALERRASPEELDEAKIEAAFARYLDWEAAGRPGAIPHEQVRAELLGEDAC
jgi:hypothetical protein